MGLIIMFIYIYAKLSSRSAPRFSVVGEGGCFRGNRWCSEEPERGCKGPSALVLTHLQLQGRLAVFHHTGEVQILLLET